MESLNAVAGKKTLSDVLSKSGEEMDHSLVVGEATSNISSKNAEEKVGLISVVPGGFSIQGANDFNELNPEVNSPNPNTEVPHVVLGTSRDSPKGVDLDEWSLEVNLLKANGETPLIVLDPIDEFSKGENLDESNVEVKSSHTNAGEIPPLVQDPLQDSAKERNLDESNFEVPSVEPEASEVANADRVHEYACKYCHRKFTNKQSLGGHQNAHKFERALEKGGHQNAHKFERALEKDASNDAHESSAGYFSGSSSYSRMTSSLSSHPGSLKRSYEYMSRQFQISRPYHSQLMLQHQGMHVARPVLPSMLPQAIPRHCHEFYRGYHPGWTVPVPRILTGVPTMPVPRVSEFVTAQPPYLPSVALTLQFQNPGAPSSSSRLISQAFSAFPGSRSVPGRNAGVQNNNQMIVPGNGEDLDLTLRL